MEIKLWGSTRFLALLALLPLPLPLATAQSPEWAQCGGIGYTGPTVCVAPNTCIVQNPYFYHCLPPGLTTYPPPPGWTPTPEPTSSSA